MSEHPVGQADVAQADIDRLLRYAEATYRAVTEQRRRYAAVALGVAVMFAAVTALAGLQWQSFRSQVDDIPDEALVDVLGVRIPDPRPAIQRGELRLKAFVWGVVALGSLVMTLLALAVHRLVRPPPPPADLRTEARAPP